MEPHVREALETELAGVEQRLLRVTEPEHQKVLEARVAHIKEQLGEAPAAPAKRGAKNGKEYRPASKTETPEG